MLFINGLIIFALMPTSLQRGNPSVKHGILFEFAELMDIQTWIFYDYLSEGGLLDFLAINDGQKECLGETSYLVITQKVEWHLRDFIKANILSVVYIQDNGSNSEVLNLLNLSMDRWHQKYVLFITNHTLEPYEKWLPLFHWCHYNGYFNTMLIDFEATMLLDYDHFITHQVKNTTLKDFLHYREYFSDTNGYRIRSTLGNNPPRATFWYDSHGELQISGYFALALTYFAKLYNISLVFDIISELDYYEETICLEFIRAGKTDVCADGVPMGEEFPVTQPSEITYSYLIVPYDQPLDKFYYFIRPFDPEVWAMLVGTLMYNILLLCLINYLQGRPQDVGFNALNSLLTLANLPYEKLKLKGWREKFLHVILSLTGFMITNWYLSILSSFLTSRLYSTFISDLEDLVTHNVSIMINEFEWIFLNLSEESPYIKQQLKVVDNAELIYNRRNLIPTYAYYSQYDKTEYYLGQQRYMQRPRMMELDLEIHPVMGGIPMRNNFPFEDKMHTFFFNLMESGLYQPIYDHVFAIDISKGKLKYFDSEKNEVEPLGLEYFHLPAVLLVLGYGLAFLSFAMEILLNAFTKKYV
uniref:Ionotropic receptor n=1 Tax=Stomoxys calcitrans TaxID=35570 RepID=A0A1I8PQF5_STOCA